MNNIIRIARFYKSFKKRNPMLYMFLKEHKVLRKFSINCRYNIEFVDSIGGAFRWDKTKEGYIYWSNLTSEYASFKINLLKEL